jgi:hypothetical protein
LIRAQNPGMSPRMTTSFVGVAGYFMGHLRHFIPDHCPIRKRRNRPFCATRIDTLLPFFSLPKSIRIVQEEQMDHEH